jgi:hypothetical protein
MFHGTYRREDVTFLLRVLDIDEINLVQKEEMIQGGKYHYSELLSHEYRPDEAYMKYFHDSMKLNLEKTSLHLLSMASYLNQFEKPLIVSLARAGTPIGVILNRMLRRFYGRETTHYSISIVKGKGLDKAAIRYILDHHPDSDMVFIDGWTSKGSINAELKASVEELSKACKFRISDALLVVSDISGTAHAAATDEDYLIPSSILNSVISGLVSRSICNKEIQADGGFHGCKFYAELADYDLSLWYVDRVMEMAELLWGRHLPSLSIGGSRMRNSLVNGFIKEYSSENRIRDPEMLKIGICETTRAMLRRIPNKVVIREDTLMELGHIIHLASVRGVPVVTEPSLPFKVMAELKSMK